MKRKSPENKPITYLKRRIRYGTAKESCPWCATHELYSDNYGYRNSDQLFECMRISTPDQAEDGLFYPTGRLITEAQVTGFDGNEEVKRKNATELSKKPQPCLKSDWEDCPLNPNNPPAKNGGVSAKEKDGA